MDETKLREFGRDAKLRATPATFVPLVAKKRPSPLSAASRYETLVNVIIAATASRSAR